jgi:hypothetical protein
MAALSRERFRVVAESEFFAGASLDWSGTCARAPRESRWARRVAGAAMVATVSALGGAIAISMSPAMRHSRGRPAVPIATHSILSDEATHAAPTTRPVIARSLLASVALHARALRAKRVQPPTGLGQREPVGRRLRPSAPARAQNLHSVRSLRSVRVQAVRRAPRPQANGVQQAPAPHEVVRPALSVSYVAPAPRARPAEFGFEH